MNKQVGQKIRSLRKKKGLSQEEVADYIHTSQSTYARIENGVGNAWAGYILPLCELFEIEPEELLKPENATINNNNNIGQFNGAYIINQLSDKLIEQFEKRIAEKNEQISQLKAEIHRLKQ